MTITPETIAASGTEQGHQTALFVWAQQSNIQELKWLFHIPNGGKRDKREAGRLKAAGVKPGVFDLFLPVARGGYHGLWVEMKRKGGYASDDQVQFDHGMTSAGYDTAVCIGWETARDYILAYLAN